MFLVNIKYVLSSPIMLVMPISSFLIIYFARGFTVMEAH